VASLIRLFGQYSQQHEMATRHLTAYIVDKFSINTTMCATVAALTFNDVCNRGCSHVQRCVQPWLLSRSTMCATVAARTFNNVCNRGCSHFNNVCNRGCSHVQQCVQPWLLSRSTMCATVAALTLLRSGRRNGGQTCIGLSDWDRSTTCHSDMNLPNAVPPPHFSCLKQSTDFRKICYKHHGI